MVTFNDLGLFGDRQVCIGSPCARVSDPEASQQGLARERHCHPWLGRMPYNKAPGKFLPLKLGQRSHTALSFPPACGTADGAQGHGSGHAAEREPRARGAGVGRKGGWAVDKTPLLGI